MSLDITLYLQLQPLLLLLGFFLVINNHAIIPSLGLTVDGVLLLSFRYSIVDDPLNTLESWNYSDQTPCYWRGITCGLPGNSSADYRVVGISLPDSQLAGTIPSDLGMIELLRTLDLSNNSLNGSIPTSLFTAASDLRFLDLSNNRISGEINNAVANLTNLQLLNLSDNALTGTLPPNLGAPPNLTVVSLRNNYLSGQVPAGFASLRVLDLSSNLIDGSLPRDFGGDSLNYLNLSHNRISGQIPPEFSKSFPGNTTLDLSSNNLTGEIPQSAAFLNQDSGAFSGNPNLCGIPTRNPCPIPSFPSSLPNVSSPTNSPPAIAAIPKTIDSTPESGNPGQSTKNNKNQPKLRSGAIIAIVVGDLAGIGIIAMVFLYVYHLKKKKKSTGAVSKEEKSAVGKETWSSTSSESRGFTRWSCLRKAVIEEDSSDDTTASDSDKEDGHRAGSTEPYKEGTLVTMDGGGDQKPLEMDSLLKASAYILGATGSSILYKAVLEDGTVLAVRRIGESSLDRFKDFENKVRSVAKLVHPNLVRVKGFYWGADEKLIIYDFVPNGSLANARYRKVGSSPCHYLPWEARLKIAKGIVRGLTYLHDKKHVHGNLKPSNILLGTDMDPKIGDFGLERLIIGDTSYKAGVSARNFGSKRSTASRDSFQDIGPGPGGLGPSPSPSPSSVLGISPYHAPESLRTLKPNPKWDVYSFGVILLELLSGKVIVVDELGQGNGVMVDDHSRAMRMADVSIRPELEGKEDALLACFKLGFSCASPVPQKRPSIKEALHVLEKVPSSSSSSSSYYFGAQ